MTFRLLPEPAAVLPVEGGRAFKLSVINGHVRPDGTGVDGMPDNGQGELRHGEEKPGVVANLGGKGVEGGAGCVGSQNGLLLPRGQLLRVLKIDKTMVADSAPRGGVVGLQKLRQPTALGRCPGKLALAVDFSVMQRHNQTPVL